MNVEELTIEQRQALAMAYEIEGDRPEIPEISDSGEVIDRQEQERRAAVEREGVERITRMMLVAVFAWAAGRAGEHWKLADNEADRLSEAMVRVIFHYWPDLQFGPAAEFMLVCVGIIGPRVAITRAQTKQLAVEGRTEGQAEAETEGEREAA